MRLLDLAQALAEKVLTIAAEKGLSEVVDLDAAALELGESDSRKVSDAGLLLQTRGLVAFVADNANVVRAKPELLLAGVQLLGAQGTGRRSPGSDLETELIKLREAAAQLSVGEWAAVDRVRGMLKMIIANEWGTRSHYLSDWQRISFKFGVGVDVGRGFALYKNELINLIDTMLQEKRLFHSARRGDGGRQKDGGEPQGTGNYVDPGRIEAMKAVKSINFDLARLVEMCEELNRCWQSGCLIAVAMLVRAILDHVPPIFGVSTFAEVVDKYQGSRSFKDLMRELQNQSRKVADQYLHMRIRPKEDLPTPVGVDSRKSLDGLLGEVIRLLMVPTR